MLAGQPLPTSLKPGIVAMGERNPPLLASKRKWKELGQSGLWVREWLPELATAAYGATPSTIPAASAS